MRAPGFGQDTDDVLRGLLGLSPVEIARVRESSVIADAPRPGTATTPGPMDLAALRASGRLRGLDDGYEQRLVAWLGEDKEQAWSE